MGLAAVVLTGGASRRMGTDKAAIAVDGVPLAVRTAGLLAAVADPVVELGPGRSGFPHLPDAGAGPLAALAGPGAAALWGRLPGDGHVLVVATDLPLLGGDVLAWLGAHPSPGTVVPLLDGHPQPLCARYPVAALRALATDPPATDRLLDWVRSLAPLLVRPPVGDARTLADADTPDDLARLVGSTRPWTGPPPQ